MKGKKTSHLSETIRRQAGESVIGTLAGAYPELRAESTVFGHRRKSGRPGLGRRIRQAAARGAETSLTAHWAERLRVFLLRCRLRSYGIFFLAFGMYSAVLYLLTAYAGTPCQSLPAAVSGLGAALAAVPLLFSGKTLSGALTDSRMDVRLERWIGLRAEPMRVSGAAGRSNIAFILGLLLGLLTYWIPAPYFLLGLLALVLVRVIFTLPEAGVPLLFFAMPLLPTLVLVCLTGIVTLSFLFKLIRGNRRLHPETLDVGVLIFGVFFLSGGLFSSTEGSLLPALVYVCFLLGFFLTACFMNTERWLSRCVSAALAAASVVSLYGIFQYVTGQLHRVNAWLDQSLFGDFAGRTVSTMENPNMLGEYLILLLPLALCAALRGRTARRRFVSWITFLLMTVCLAMTFSRSAWIAAVAAAALYLLLDRRGAFFVLLLGGASVPLWLWLLPEEITRRLLSVANLADSSIAYRLNIWRGTSGMVKDFFWGGIGVGEAPWRQIYPSYALEAIEAAPHAHSLGLQILVELGIFGLLAFLLVLVLLVQSNFRYYRELGEQPLPAEESRRTYRRRTASMKAFAAAPLCGVFAACVFGLADYSWYNYRVYLLFWLVLGLSSGYVRTGRQSLRESAGTEFREMSPGEADLELALARPRRHRKDGRKGV